MLAAIIVVKRINRDDSITVESAEAEIRTVYSSVSESGVIQPTIEVPMAPDVSGEVVGLFIKEGMKVKKGDLLVTIQPDNYRSAVEQSEASLNQIRANEQQAKANSRQFRANVLQDSINMARTKLLFDQKVVSQADLEAATLRYNLSRAQYEGALFSIRSAGYQIKSAEASLRQARQNLNRTNIYASMDGTVTSLKAEVGQRVVGTMQMAGTEILKIADLSSMEVVVEVSENDIVNLSMGDSALIEVDAFPGKSFFGKVSEIAYSAKSAGALGATTGDQVTNFEVKVSITPASYNNAGISELPKGGSPFRPGMTALVQIFTQQERDAVCVPIRAVTVAKSKPAASGKSKTGATDTPKPEATAAAGAAAKTGKQEVVFIIRDGVAHEVPVATGISDDSYIVIKEGVNSGDKVVTGPYGTLTRTLKEGDAVKIDSGEKKSKKVREN